MCIGNEVYDAIVEHGDTAGDRNTGIIAPEYRMMVLRNGGSTLEQR